MAAESNLNTFNPVAIPAELKSRPQWVCWRYVERDRRPTKMPVNPRTGLEASVTDPSTWGGFDEAAARSEDGIGFVFSEEDPFCGVDLDGVLDPETGEIETWALEVVETLDSYTEVSPSGTGLHVIVEGELPGSRKRRGKIEVYDSGRFFTVTGERYPGTPGQPRDRQEALDAVYAERIAPAGAEGSPGALQEPISPEMPDEEVLERCRRAGNAAKFEALWAGNTSAQGGDHSAADQALISMLAFYTQDKEQLDRLFRRSGLVREKWTSRPDYRERTIRFALTADRGYYGAEREWPTVVMIDDMRDANGIEAPNGNAGGDAGDTVTPGGGAAPTPTADVPPFPVDALPPVLRRLVLEAAHAKECPPDFVAVPLLPALGVAVGASRSVELARTYREHPIVWTAVVAPPASGKSPAEDVAMGPVEEQRKAFAQEHRRALEAWREEHADWEMDAADARKRKKRVPPEPEKPVKERIRVGDTTLEALLLRLTENPRGLILGRDELAGFFGAMGQYKGGKGSDREAWLSLHSGRTPPLDRKSADEAHDVFHPHVSVVGSIQPGRMDVLDTGAGDGMVERFLICWPEAKLLPDAEEDISVEAEEAYRRVWRFLYALQPEVDEYGNLVPKSVPLSAGARDAWKRHRRTLKEAAYRPGTPEYIQGVLGKLRAYLARLALILALVRVAEGGGAAPETVEAEDVERAWGLVSYFLAHARRVHSELRDEGRPQSRQSMLAGALGELLEATGGEWRGTATELFDALKEIGHGRALPKVPDSLTEEVLKAARRTPALHAEKGRTGKGRYVRIAWATPVGGGATAEGSVTASPVSSRDDAENGHDAA